MRRPCVGETVRRGYAAEAIGGLICSPRRGCVANTACLKSEQGGRSIRGRSVLRQPKLARIGGSLRSQIEMDIPPLLLAILARGGGRSRGGELSPPFDVSPRDNGDTW